MTEVPIPARKTRKEYDQKYNSSARGHQRQSVYAASEKGLANRRKYNRRVGNKDYLDRPFVMWDGEGVTVGESHLYTSFASSSGVRCGNDKGLPSDEIFDALLTEKEKDDAAIHVVYGASYDWNMWLTDLPQSPVEKLYETGSVLWKDYRLEWRRGKSFRIKDRTNGTSITIYDVVSFFQRPFVQACDEYLGDRFYKRDLIVKMKARRGNFTIDEQALVDEYNDAELVNGVLLMTELRERLHKVGLRPRRWDGPGAIAAALLAREGIKNAMAPVDLPRRVGSHSDSNSMVPDNGIPEQVSRAARFAYFGGRFEVIRCGDVGYTESGSQVVAYEYDINSAYPSALRHVPNLRRGNWRYVGRGEVPGADIPFDMFGVWHCVWRGDNDNLLRPHPFPVRLRDGRVCYPLNSEGYYWSPEVATARGYGQRYGGNLEILEGWIFEENDPSDKPFAFIEPMYLKRQALKKAKDGAHVGIKLALNSLYGKTCQRVGFSVDQSGNVKPPPFHQLEWAGYVTSHCRGTALSAALENLDAIIAFETDALFSTTPLKVKVGNGLGLWEETQFTHLCYVQSGFYFGQVDGTPFEKTRGVDRGTLTYQDVREALCTRPIPARFGEASLSRFVGVGLARQLNDWSRWQRWETNPKLIKLEPQGKRVHEHCSMCDDSVGLTLNVWHYTYPPFGGMMVSSEYPIPWINPDPAMTDLDDINADRREDMAAYYE